MTNEDSNNLTEEKIQQLLAAVGSKPDDDTMNNADAVEYDWRQPHFFSRSQLDGLKCFTTKIAQNLVEKFNQIYHSDFNVEIASTTQHFANEFSTETNIQDDYYLTFSNKDQEFGIVGLPSKVAVTWATQLLGDNKSEEGSDRPLSQLEQSLLSDIASGIIGALSNSCDDYELQPAGKIIRTQMPIEFKGTDELCKITFNVKRVDSENSSEAYLLIYCDKLQAITGQKVETSDEFSEQDISKAMHNHVQQIPVSIKARLASTMITFEEIMSLQTNDILLFDKRVDEPTELIIEGKMLFRGRPVKSDGKYAVLITEQCSSK